MKFVRHKMFQALIIDRSHENVATCHLLARLPIDETTFRILGVTVLLHFLSQFLHGPMRKWSSIFNFASDTSQFSTK